MKLTLFIIFKIISTEKSHLGLGIASVDGNGLEHAREGIEDHGLSTAGGGLDDLKQKIQKHKFGKLLQRNEAIPPLTL